MSLLALHCECYCFCCSCCCRCCCYYSQCCSAAAAAAATIVSIITTGTSTSTSTSTTTGTADATSERSKTKGKTTRASSGLAAVPQQPKQARNPILPHGGRRSLQSWPGSHDPAAVPMARQTACAARAQAPRFGYL